MHYTIHPPIAISECGMRANNEDYCYPSPKCLDCSDALIFIVCDGVGGAQKGEIASRLAVEKLVEYFKLQEKPLLIEAVLTDCLKYIQLAFDQYIDKIPQSIGMATTIALLQLHTQGIIIAHIGDSRVYHIRAGSILHRTKDHSLVNDLVDSGLIDKEAALTHPKRNVITRAIQGNGKSKGRFTVTNVIADIQADDYFFLCTDGILEGLSEAALLAIIKTNGNNVDKMGQIKRQCQLNAHDNYTAILIQIKK